MNYFKVISLVLCTESLFNCIEEAPSLVNALDQFDWYKNDSFSVWGNVDGAVVSGLKAALAGLPKISSAPVTCCFFQLWISVG